MKIKRCFEAKGGILHPPHVWESEYGPRKCEGLRIVTKGKVSRLSTSGEED